MEKMFWPQFTVFSAARGESFADQSCDRHVSCLEPFNIVSALRFLLLTLQTCLEHFRSFGGGWVIFWAFFGILMLGTLGR